jgi:hypothetical protein
VSPRAQWWLLLAGACIGLLCAAAQVVQLPNAAPPEGYVASVNGTLISETLFRSQLETLAADKRTPLSEDDRRFVLQRLVEEELLVQHALEIGMATSHAPVRATLVKMVRDSMLAEPLRAPDEDELREFYEARSQRLAQTTLHSVRQIVITGPDAQARAAEARRELASETDRQTAEAVDGRFGDRAAARAPLGLLSDAKLAQWVGADTTRQLMKLQVGQTLAPKRRGQAWDVFVLTGRQEASPPPFERARPELQRAHEREQRERNFRAYLEDLHSAAEVRLARAF